MTAFRIIKQAKFSAARAAVLKTLHNEIKTPAFMPVATRGVLKNIGQKELKILGYDLILSNTYHLILRPGTKIIKKLGGLHQFISWPKSIITDSGGFQIYSLSGIKKHHSNKNLIHITPKGVNFKSYLDGKNIFLTPQQALKNQIDLGVDIAVCLDQCIALPASYEQLKSAVNITTNWAKKTKKYLMRQKYKPLVFAVIQGGLNKELRLKSATELIELDFDGYNIGGLSVGETADEMYQVLDYLCPILPISKPRYLMGVGRPENIVESIKRGVDLFDCVIPSREGRHGRLFIFKPNAQNIISNYILGKTKKLKNFYQTENINNAKFTKSLAIINKNSKIPELKIYNYAYLRYLFQINDPLGQRLASLNNLEFYKKLMDYCRQAIID